MTMRLPKPTPTRHVLNPVLYEAARRRWPGATITPAVLFDVAILENIQHHVPSSPRIAAALRKELITQQSVCAREANIRQQFKQIGFDPTRNYLAKE
jgi:hypothetical protein